MKSEYAVRHWFLNLRCRAVLFGLLMLLLCLFPVRAGAAGIALVEDQAGVLSESEKEELKQLLEKACGKTGYDLMVLSVENAGGRTSRKVAEDFFDKNCRGDDGIVYLIDFDNRELYVATTGEAIFYLTDSRVAAMLDRAYEYASRGTYKNAFKVMIQETVRYYESGTGAEMTVDEDTGEVTYYNTKGRIRGLTSTRILLSIMFGGVCSAAFAGTVTLSYRMKFKKYKYDFHKHSSCSLSVRNDSFVNKFVTTRRIPRNPPPSGGLSGGGRSSIHIGSGGRSFGGGGRKF